MSSFLDDLEAQLAAAARSRTARGADGPSPRRPRLWGAAVRRNLPVLAAAAVTLAVVVAAFALLGHARRSSRNAPASSLGMLLSNIPSRHLREEGGYIRAATRQVQASPACRTSFPTRTTIIRGSPGPALLSTVAVLRRPVSSADRLSAQALQTVSEPVYGNAVRLTRVVGHTAYYLVPTREDLAAWQPSPRCFQLQAAALHRYAPRIPTALRSQTLALFAQLSAFDRSMIANAPRNTLCLVSVGGDNSGTGCGLTAAEIRDHGSGLSDDSGTVSELLPDGVATVTLRFPAARGRSAYSVTGRVFGNLMAVRAPHMFGGSADQPTAVWRAADGRILKTITPPTPTQVQAYCRQHEALCATTMLATSGSASSSGGALSASSSSATSTTASAAPKR